jgi:hypothetical protein
VNNRREIANPQATIIPTLAGSRLQKGIVTMNKISIWVSFLFCTAISYLALFTSLIPGSWWHIPFLSFLPMTFFFIANNTYRMSRDLEALQKRVELLESSRP